MLSRTELQVCLQLADVLRRQRQHTTCYAICQPLLKKLKSVAAAGFLALISDSTLLQLAGGRALALMNSGL